MSLETGGNIFIGTGNVFEMPPKEFVEDAIYENVITCFLN